VTHACNPSNSGGRNQEDYGSKPARANSSPDPISKNPSQRRADVGPEFKPQYCNKKKKRKEKKKERKEKKRKKTSV
jgi:hypothetical protein